MKKEAYKILLLPSGQRDLDDIKDKTLLLRLKESMLKLKDDPRPPGCVKLLGSKDSYRIRVGDYRYCYRVDAPNKIIYIYRVKHRREAYR